MKFVCDVFWGGGLHFVGSSFCLFFQIITPHHPRGFPYRDSEFGFHPFFPYLGENLLLLHSTQPIHPSRGTCVDIQGNHPCQSRDEYHPILNAYPGCATVLARSTGGVPGGNCQWFWLVSPKKRRPAIFWGGVRGP